MNSAVEIIRTKRDGGRLPAEDIDWLLAAYTRGEVAEEQMSALLMAILVNGMDAAETAAWTRAMLASGTRLQLSNVGKPLADKHSTGGVGDKVTLVLAPLLAACGAAVPHLAGRGLGHTGGTLDKLGTIPGWQAELGAAQIVTQLRELGAVICAATASVAPADRKLYALRDVTGTVESIPLIAASIMSKKLAAGADALVLDVKVGSGAFMKTPEQARRLANALVAIGRDNGLPTVAVLTAMDTPLGNTAGNALEVAEAVEVLAGAGPADVIELTLTLAREALRLVGIDAEPADALADGRALSLWRSMIAAQGGDPDAPLPHAAEIHTVVCPATGRLTRLDAYAVGLAAWRLGAGRARPGDAVSAAAGVRWHARPGHQVVRGEPLLELHTDDAARNPDALAALDGAYDIDGNSAALPLVIDRVDGSANQ